MPNLLLTPVLPPIEESTCDRSVDGILINFNPLLYILAAKPATSPEIPPPKHIIASFLEKLFLNNIFSIEFT